MPLYGFINRTLLQKNDLNFNIKVGSDSYKINIFSSEYKGVTTYFIDLPLFSESEDFYTHKCGGYTSENPGFGIFSAAIVEIAKLLNVDIVHLNDWHTALAALLIKEHAPQIKTIFTIHNLAFQGIFSKDILKELGIDECYFTIEGIEFYNKVSFIKAGIVYSDLITTVSPQYAKEILTERFGCGLHSVLNFHSEKLFGILNGIDYELYDPKRDKALLSNFDSESLDLKNINKLDLLKELDLEVSDKPTFVMISRLVQQKGFDLLIDSLEDILKNELNLVILADGESSYRLKLEVIAKKYDNFYLTFGYDEDFSHRIYAGADFLLMPSLFEPCGLNQMIAMRYGTIAVVHGVGGLLDTVYEEQNRCGGGIVFLEESKESFLSAIQRSMELYKDKQKKENIVRSNMRCDFSFDKSALLYKKLYNRLLE
jgi:starch synthase